jgi:hypothetical protein
MKVRKKPPKRTVVRNFPDCILQLHPFTCDALCIMQWFKPIRENGKKGRFFNDIGKNLETAQYQLKNH